MTEEMKDAIKAATEDFLAMTDEEDAQALEDAKDGPISRAWRDWRLFLEHRASLREGE